MSDSRFLPIGLASAATGCAPTWFTSKIDSGRWREGEHYVRQPGGDPLISMAGYERFIVHGDNWTPGKGEQPPRARVQNGPTQLYRHFDAEGRLLYVGISLSVVHRLQQHLAGSSWAHEITRVEVAKYATRGEALAAERAAIETEKPLHNKQHNWAEPPRQGPNAQALLEHLSKRKHRRGRA